MNILHVQTHENWSIQFDYGNSQIIDEKGICVIIDEKSFLKRNHMVSYVFVTQTVLFIHCLVTF